MIYTNGNGELSVPKAMRSSHLNHKISLCWPARYNVKQLAYETMCSRFADVETSETTPTRSTAIEVRQLLEVVDEILREEAYTNDEEIPTFDDPATILSCGFCGGEVFQKFFRCRNECPREETYSTSTDAILICTSCYIDGRTCLCGEMSSFRLLPMAPMVAARNKVAAWLRNHGKDVLLSDESGDDADIDRHDIAELSVPLSSS